MVDTLGHLLALKVTAAKQQDRDQVGELAEAVQQVTGQNRCWRPWKHGADGYLLKESGTQRIVDAIFAILNGGTVFDPVVRRDVPDNLPSGAVNPLDSLADRERRVLVEVAQGKTDKEVALALGLTTKTARNYLDHIFTRLGLHTRTEAAFLHARFSEKSRWPD